MDNFQAPSTDIQKHTAHFEAVVLATLLSYPSSFETVKDSLHPADFFTPAAQKMFKWIADSYKDGHPASMTQALVRYSTPGQESDYAQSIMLEIPDEDSVLSNAMALKDMTGRLQGIMMLQQRLLDLHKHEIPAALTMSKIEAGVKEAANKLSASKSGLLSFAQIGGSWREAQAEKATGNYLNGVKTGFTDIDERLVNLEPGDLVIVAGRPAMGKTSFAFNIFENMARNSIGKKTSSGKPKIFLIYSLEMPAIQLFGRSVSSIGGIDARAIKTAKYDIGEVEKIGVTASYVEQLPLLVDDTPRNSVDQMHRDYVRISKDYEIGGIMVDYLQLMSVPSQFIGNANGGVSHNSGRLKELAKLAGCPVVCLSQLNRSLEQRANKRPVNADLRESGAIEQDADIIMFVYRDEVYNPETELKGTAEIIFGKLRSGEVGTDTLAWKGRYTRFENLDEQKSSLQGQRDLEESRRETSFLRMNAEDAVPAERPDVRIIGESLFVPDKDIPF